MPRYFLPLALFLLLGILRAQTDTIYGDLTDDGIPEMLVSTVHNPPLVDSVYGDVTLKTARVYRKLDGAWQHWKAASGYLMHAYEEAGMARFNPNIERGTLVLIHGKGGYTSFETTHRFRWQNEQFELIGYTSSLWERCEGSSKFDYNLSTGTYHIENAVFNCDHLREGDAPETTTEYWGKHRRKTPYLLLQSEYLDITIDQIGQELRGF